MPTCARASASMAPSLRRPPVAAATAVRLPPGAGTSQETPRGQPRRKGIRQPHYGRRSSAPGGQIGPPLLRRRTHHLTAADEDVTSSSTTSETAAPGKTRRGAVVKELRVDEIRRPLAGTRDNDPLKVQWLMVSIAEIGLQEPIDVLEVDGVHYGFSGCHRYEAHQRLGYEHIRCRVRKANKTTLKMHLM